MAVTIGKKYLIANNGGFAESTRFWVGPRGSSTPDVLTGFTAQLRVLQQGQPASAALVYTSTDASPYLLISGNAVSWAIPDTVTSAWLAAVYDMQLRVWDPLASPIIDRYDLMYPGGLVVLLAPGT